jgi:endo-1,3(4)-beta-glucanase
VKDLVEWTMPVLKGVSEKRKGFLYACQGIYDNEGGEKNIKCLKMKIGNLMTNLL